AVLWRSTGDQDALRIMFRPGEQDGSSQRAVGFGDLRLRISISNQARGPGSTFGQQSARRAGVFVDISLFEGNQPDSGQAGSALGLFRSTHTRIERFQRERQCDAAD